MPELSGLSKRLLQQLSLSGIKAPSPQAGFVFCLEQRNGLKGELLQASGPSLPLNFARTKRFTRQGSQLQGANDRNPRHPGPQECSQVRKLPGGGGPEGRKPEPGAQFTVDLPLGSRALPGRSSSPPGRMPSPRIALSPPGIRQLPPADLSCTAPGNCCLVSV